MSQCAPSLFITNSRGIRRTMIWEPHCVHSPSTSATSGVTNRTERLATFGSVTSDHTPDGKRRAKSRELSARRNQFSDFHSGHTHRVQCVDSRTLQLADNLIGGWQTDQTALRGEDGAALEGDLPEAVDSEEATVPQLSLQELPEGQRRVQSSPTELPSEQLSPPLL